MARKSENVHDEVTKAEVHNIFPDLYEVTIQTKPHGGSNAKSCDGRHHANGLREIRSRFAIKKPLSPALEANSLPFGPNDVPSKSSYSRVVM